MESDYHAKEDGRYRGLDLDEEEYDTFPSKVITDENAPTLQEIVKEQAEHIKMLEKQLAQYTEINGDNESKKRKFNPSDIVAIADANDAKDTRINELTKQVTLLTEELVAEKRNREDKSNEGKIQQHSIHENEKSIINSTDQLMKMIEEKLNGGLDTIQKNVEKLVNEKFNNIPSNIVVPDSEAHSTSSLIRSYADTAGNQGSAKNFRNIMMATKNEERAEEADRKSRGKNLIIHGKEEIEPNTDKEFVDNLIKELQIGVVNVQLVDRIGQVTQGRKRPLKMVLNNEEDQQKVLHNLTNLKGKPSYKGISITEDYTYNERILIREFAEQAKLKNAEEDKNKSNIVWRVRGTPKNGLVIKRFTKANQETISQ